MNRKLIRPNLADVKPKERDARPPIERGDGSAAHAARRIVPAKPAAPAAAASGANAAETAADGASATAATKANHHANARRAAPPAETNAKIYYYKKQIDSHTRMRILLADNEEIEGTIEWYDRGALKINRKNAPNIMLLEHNIKYMYKAED